MPKLPIIYLASASDQAALMRLIWTPRWTYDNILTVDAAVDRWVEMTCVNGDARYPIFCVSERWGINGFGYGYETYVSRMKTDRFGGGYTPVNSIRHFAEYLKRLS